MIRKYKCCDLFCGAGGSAVGLSKAGFEIVGVDHNCQPNYPFEFWLEDVFETDISGFDFYWASPPCQAYSFGSSLARRRGKEYPDLISKTREFLKRTDKPYIIENVVRAPLINPIRLCGLMFDLKVIRWRLFESNLNLKMKLVSKKKGTVENKDYVSVAGHGGHGSNKYSVWCDAMQIDWMTKEELAQAIPPVYSEFLGKQVIKYLDIRK